MSKKKHKKQPKLDLYREDCHHLLFIGRRWSNGWAKILREHPYSKIYIPQMTLHRMIHLEVKDVPVPEGAACRMAVEAINSWLEAGYISMDDRLDRRVEVLSWCFNAKYPCTAKALLKQGEIAKEFYEGESQ